MIVITRKMVEEFVENETGAILGASPLFKQDMSESDKFWTGVFDNPGYFDENGDMKKEAIEAIRSELEYMNRTSSRLAMLFVE